MDQLFAVTPYGWYASLALFSGILVSYLYLNRVRRYPMHIFLAFGVMTVPCVFVLSRLVFVLANCTYYLTTLSKPVLALYFWDGGYSMMGAFFGACLAAFLTGRLMHLSPRVFLDSVGMGFPIAAVIARLAEAGTGLGEGRPIDGGFIPPLAPEGFDGFLHPVFLYEALAALVIFVVLQILSRAHHQLPHEGDLLLMEMTCYGLCEVFLESLKDDGHMVVHFVRIQQVLAIVLVVVAMVVWARRIRTKKKDILICALITIGAIGLAILSEFGVDRWGNRLLAYGLMLVCLLSILLCAMHLYHLTLKEGLKG